MIQNDNKMIIKYEIKENNKMKIRMKVKIKVKRIT